MSRQHFDLVAKGRIVAVMVAERLVNQNELVWTQLRESFPAAPPKLASQGSLSVFGPPLRRSYDALLSEPPKVPSVASTN